MHNMLTSVFGIHNFVPDHMGTSFWLYQRCTENLAKNINKLSKILQNLTENRCHVTPLIDDITSRRSNTNFCMPNTPCMHEIGMQSSLKHSQSNQRAKWDIPNVNSRLWQSTIYLGDESVECAGLYLTRLAWLRVSCLSHSPNLAEKNARLLMGSYGFLCPIRSPRLHWKYFS